MQALLPFYTFRQKDGPKAIGIKEGPGTEMNESRDDRQSPNEANGRFESLDVTT